MTDELPANPFIVGPPVPPDRFIGRQREVRTILARLDNPRNRGGSAISGERRIGKTSLLHYVESDQALASCANLSPNRAKFLYLNGHLIAPLVAEQFWTSVFSPLSGCQELEGNLRVLAQSMSQKVPGKDSLVDFFCKVGEAGYLVVALFDEFDAVMDYIDPANPELFYTLRSLLNQPSPRGFSLVVASRTPLETLFWDVRWRGSEFYNNMEMIALRPFEQSEMDQLLNIYLEGSGIQFDSRLRNFLFEVSKGYPQAIQRGGSILFDEIVRAKKESTRWSFTKKMRDDIGAVVARDKPQIESKSTGQTKASEQAEVPGPRLDLSSAPYFDWDLFTGEWRRCKDLTFSANERDLATEKAMAILLAPAFTLVKEHLRTSTAEFDLILGPRPDDVLWGQYGPWVAVQVDNRGEPTTWADVSSFVRKVGLTRLRLAFYVSVFGFTERVTQSAELLNASQSEFRLITIAGQEIDDLIAHKIPPFDFLSSKLLKTTFGAEVAQGPLLRLASLESLLYGPPRSGLLRNYRGYVSARIVSENGEPLPLSNDGTPVAKEGQVCKLIVSIQKRRPAGGGSEPIRITDGQDRKEVFFSVDFDSPTIKARPKTLSLRVEPESEELTTDEFEITATPKGHHDLYIHVRQQILIQVLRQKLTIK